MRGRIFRVFGYRGREAFAEKDFFYTLHTKLVPGDQRRLLFSEVRNLSLGLRFETARLTGATEKGRAEGGEGKEVLIKDNSRGGGYQKCRLQDLTKEDVEWGRMGEKVDVAQLGEVCGISVAHGVEDRGGLGHYPRKKRTETSSNGTIIGSEANFKIGGQLSTIEETYHQVSITFCRLWKNRTRARGKSSGNPCTDLWKKGLEHFLVPPLGGDDFLLFFHPSGFLRFL